MLLTGNLSVEQTEYLDKELRTVLADQDSLLEAVTDYSGDITSTDTSVKITVARLGEGQMIAEGAEANSTNNSYAKVDMLLNERAVASFDSTGLADIVEGTAEATVAEKKATKGFKGALKINQKSINSKIFATVNAAVPVGNVIGDGLSDISEDTYSEMSTILDENGAPKDDRYAMLSGTQQKKTMKLPAFFQNTSNLSVTVDGTTMKIVGKIYGFTVLDAGSRAGQNNLFLSKSAVGAAFKTPNLKTNVSAEFDKEETFVNVYGNVMVAVPEYTARAVLKA